jgi:hypothetical protein
MWKVGLPLQMAMLSFGNFGFSTVIVMELVISIKFGVSNKLGCRWMHVFQQFLVDVVKGK